MSARTKVRRRALDVLFEADAKGVGNDPDELRALAAQRTRTMVAQVTLPPYAARMVEGVAANLGAIDRALSEHARGWTLERMPSVDRAALRLGVWEIWFNDEVDPPVTIDEMVSIVAELSTDRSPRFVNGLLDAIAKEPRTEAVASAAPAAVPEASASEVTGAEAVPDIGDDAPDEVDALDAAWKDDAPLPPPEGMEAQD